MKSTLLNSYKPTFLVLWGGGLGDALVLRPMLQAIERAGFELVMASRGNHATSVIAEMGIQAKRVHLSSMPLAALRELRLLRPIEVAYVCPHASIKTRVLAWLSGARKIWASHPGHGSEFIGTSISNDSVRLGLQREVPQSYGDPPFFVGRSPLPPRADHTLIFHPGARAAWQTTRWPESHWIELLRRTSALVQHHIVLVGSADEADMLTRIKRAAGNIDRVTIVVGASLHYMESLISNSELVVCHNSGVMHIAAALKKSTLIITGSSATYWRPAFDWCHSISSGQCELACNKRKCPIPTYEARCINGLVVEQVFSMLKGLLADTRPGDLSITQPDV